MLTYVLAQISEEKEKKRVSQILSKVNKHNDGRQVVAHSRFEPAGDGVKFTRIVARGGTVTPPRHGLRMNSTVGINKCRNFRMNCSKSSQSSKPAKGYIMAAEGAGYAAIFAAVGGSKANAEVRKAGD